MKILSASVSVRPVTGFTLIELLVVLVILALLGAIVGPRVMKHVGSAKSDAARIQLEELGASLDIYSLETGGYPTTEQGLTALVAAPTGVSNWNGPYLRKPVIPRDPWGNDYHYSSPGQHGPFDLFSFGADNVVGGEKDNRDIVSWE